MYNSSSPLQEALETRCVNMLLYNTAYNIKLVHTLRLFGLMCLFERIIYESLHTYFNSSNHAKHSLTIKEAPINHTGAIYVFYKRVLINDPIATHAQS